MEGTRLANDHNPRYTTVVPNLVKQLIVVFVLSPVLVNAQAIKRVNSCEPRTEVAASHCCDNCPHCDMQNEDFACSASKNAGGAGEGHPCSCVFCGAVATSAFVIPPHCPGIFDKNDYSTVVETSEDKAQALRAKPPYPPPRRF